MVLAKLDPSHSEFTEQLNWLKLVKKNQTYLPNISFNIAIKYIKYIDLLFCIVNQEITIDTLMCCFVIQNM